MSTRPRRAPSRRRSRRPNSGCQRYSIVASTASYAEWRASWRSGQGDLVRRPGGLPVQQAPGTGSICLAVAGAGPGVGDAGATGDAIGGHRLADAAADLASVDDGLILLTNRSV